MSADAWSALAAIFSFVTAVIVAVVQYRRERKQRSFELYALWNNLQGTLPDNVNHNRRLFNLVNYTARLVYHGHIDKEIFIDLYGSTYLEVLAQLREQRYLGNDATQTVEQLLSSRRYYPVASVETTIIDSLAAKEHDDVCRTC